LRERLSAAVYDLALGQYKEMPAKEMRLLHKWPCWKNGFSGATAGQWE
jgi:hypothetical protein